jgi:D-serine deaminase-like pyridoxal phosphate-dependent protein
MVLDDLTQPTLLLDEQRCQANILRMCQKAADQHILLRPHFKTHQSRGIGQWFKDMGVDKITVSSVGMARYFADDAWTDITIAFPVNIRQLEEINYLASKVRLGLLVLDAETVDLLGKSLEHSVSIWIKIDVGTHRTGILPKDIQALNEIITRTASYPHLVFQGFIAHAGHTYHSRSQVEAQQIYVQSMEIMMDLKRHFVSQYPQLKISLGDTPGASMVDSFGPVDELRPGNYVFYDLMQEQIGACTADEIAVAMACPVVAVHPGRKQWVIYGGAIHFSKDFIILDDGRKCFGRTTYRCVRGKFT